MKKIIDKQKGVDIVNNAVAKADNARKIVVDQAQKRARVALEKTKQEIHKHKMQKFKPVFSEIFSKNGSGLPNIIMIVDDVDRREIDVCAGAVGWLGKENGIEILYLYDEAVQISAINFIPMATNDTIYYVDNFDKNRFLKTDYIFGKAYEERMAELKHIAFSLGAKSCSVEISESSIETEIHRKEHKGKQAINGLPAVNESISANFDQSRSGKRKETRMGRVYARFHGSDIPKKPELKWFRNDENIKRLIEMRFESGNSIKSEQFELSGSSSATMSQKTAAAIDMAIKKAKIKGNFKAGTTVSAQVIRECNSKLLYSIEF